MTRLASLALSTAIVLSQVATLAAADRKNAVTDLRAARLQDEISTRIVGGDRAEKNAWPWQVVLYIKDKSGSFAMSCGGSLIQQGWVLTAAHCVNSLTPGDYAIVEGTSHIDSVLQKKGPGRQVAIRRVVRHEGYNAQTHENDIALLELDSPAFAKPVRLAFGDKSALEAAGTPATVTGWGTLQALTRDGRDAKTGDIVIPDDPKYFTNELMQVEIPLVSEDDCKKSYPGAKMDVRMLCAGLPEGGKDSCQGDSGGPLVTKTADGDYRQIGVVSFGRQCAAKDAFGVYARVSAFEDWLTQNTQLPLAQDNAPTVQAPSPTAPYEQTKPDLPPAPPSKLTNPAGVAVSFSQGDSIRVGQKVQFKVTTAKSGFLVLLDVGPNRKMTQIFPNERSLSTATGKKPKANFVEAGQTVLIPDPKNPFEGFAFTADPPAGQGLLVAILSAEPLKSVPLPSGPVEMEGDGALDFLTKVSDELGRSIEVVGIGAAAAPAPAPAAPAYAGKLRDWSFATKTYRITQ